MSHAESYFANFDDSSVDEYVKTRILASPREMERLRLAVALVPPDAESLLDVGAGPGVFLHLLQQERPIRAAGIELTPSKVEYARREFTLDMQVGSADRLPFADGSFHTVTAFEVIEHLPFGVYERTLGELARVASSHVIVGVPYREDRQMIRCPYCAAHFSAIYHLRSFEDATLKALLPGWHLRSLTPHGSAHRLPWPLNLWRKLRPDTTLPEFAVCPSCGYHRERSGPLAIPATGNGLPSRRRALTRWLPRVKVHRWVFAVYEKADRR